MLRSGLRRTNTIPASSSSDSESDKRYRPPAQQQRGHKTRGRGGGKTGAQAGRQKRIQTEPEQHSDDQHSNTGAEELHAPSSSARIPDHKNYHDVGLDWGLARAEQVLASLDIPKNNRPSAAGLFEAQGLQAAYNLDKTMLCIVLKCSRRVLDEAL